MRTRLMTTLMLVAGLMLVVGQALAQSQLPNFQSGDVLRADQLNRIVEQVRRNANAAGSSGGGVTHTVDCNAGETIQSKVDAAQPGDTIVITGTCNEAVVVNKDDITLDGGRSAIIDAMDFDDAAIFVDGRQNVTIKGLTVQNGLFGIKIVEGAAVWLEDFTARNSRIKSGHDSGNGIMAVQSTSVVLAGAIISDGNERHGLGVYRGSGAVVVGNATVEERRLPPTSLQTDDNGEHGIQVSESSALAVFSAYAGNTAVRTRDNKKYSGIEVNNGSSLIVVGGDFTATGNASSGLAVGGSSSVGFYGWADQSKGVTAVFDGNTSSGITVWGSSSLQVWDDGVAVNITSSNNSGSGLGIFNGSAAEFSSPDAQPSSRLTFSNNRWDGISIDNNGTLDSSFPSEIKNNGYEGVDAWGSSYVYLKGATVADNTGHGVEVNGNSSAYLDSITVTGNGGSGIFAVTTSSVHLNASHIENSGEDGIQTGNNSTVHIYGTTITGNTGHGIAAYNLAFVQAFQDVGSSITGNDNHGLTAWNGASFQLYNATITGNTNNAISASFGSRFYLSGGTVTGTISCDDSVLSQGDWLCPANN